MNQHSKNSLAILLKNPQKGKVKTRLAKSMGEEKALEIYHYLLNYTLDIAEEVDGEVTLFFSDFIDEKLSENFEAVVQNGKDLGERMRNALARMVALGYHKIILIGSDCPYIAKAHLDETYEKLNNHDVVIGPAKDGGYYLIAFSALHGDVFSNIDWSTDKVLQQSLQYLDENHLQYHLLETLEDIDTELDWNKYVNAS